MVLRPARHNGCAGGATAAHNTLSAETTHVRVFYPFHPLHGYSLRVIRIPKRGDGAVSVMDRAGKRLKIPVWMISPDAAEIGLSARAHLSGEALLHLVSLIAKGRPTEIHDNLLHTSVDGCKGGHHAAATALEPDANRRGTRAGRRAGEGRTGRSHGPDSRDGVSDPSEDR